MTKKDFELIAKILHIAFTAYQDDINDRRIVKMIDLEFARHLQVLYPRFDKDKFLQACGVEVELGKCRSAEHYTDIEKDNICMACLGTE